MVEIGEKVRCIIIVVHVHVHVYHLNHGIYIIKGSLYMYNVHVH
jgi:hypothetical protein